MFKAVLVGAGALVTLAACGHVDQYEAQVEDFEPIYCYQSLAGTECFRTPYHRDERRLVNYFGPHPSRYEKPVPPVAPEPQAPQMINYWVKDPEPIPLPSPVGNLSDRPWLTSEGRAEAHTAERKADGSGTLALLRAIADQAAKPAALVPNLGSALAPVPAAQPVPAVEPAMLIETPYSR